MAWVESHTVLVRHRKLIALARGLRLKPVYTLGHLHALWHAVLEQQEDGDLSSWPDETIAHAAEFEGDAATLVSLLKKSRWLDDKGTVHDWLDYAGLYLTRKYANRNTQRLVEIWAKHGRVYGERAKRVSSNLAATKQQLLAPQDGRSVSLSSENSSLIGTHEIFNRGLHHDIKKRAIDIVAYFQSKVQSQHRSTAIVAENVVAQMLIDEPLLSDDIIRFGIDQYAKEVADSPRNKRSGPQGFFEKRSWESYHREGVLAKPAIAGPTTMTDIDILTGMKNGQ